MFQPILNGWLQGLAMVGAPALLWLLKQLIDFIALHIRDKRTRAIVERLGDLAYRITTDVYQSYVSPAKALGRWGDLEKGYAKDAAITAIKQHLGMQGLKEILWLLGGDQTIDLDKIISPYVESAVQQTKQDRFGLDPAYSVPISRGPEVDPGFGRHDPRPF